MVRSMVTNIYALRLVNWSYCNIANCMVIEYSDCYAMARCTHVNLQLCYLLCLYLSGCPIDFLLCLVRVWKSFTFIFWNPWGKYLFESGCKSWV